MQCFVFPLFSKDYGTSCIIYYPKPVLCSLCSCLSVKIIFFYNLTVMDEKWWNEVVTIEQTWQNNHKGGTTTKAEQPQRQNNHKGRTTTKAEQPQRQNIHRGRTTTEAEQPQRGNFHVFIRYDKVTFLGPWCRGVTVTFDRTWQWQGGGGGSKEQGCEWGKNLVIEMMLK